MNPSEAINFLRSVLVTSDGNGHQLSGKLKAEAAEALSVLETETAGELKTKKKKAAKDAEAPDAGAAE